MFRASHSDSRARLLLVCTCEYRSSITKEAEGPREYLLAHRAAAQPALQGSYGQHDRKALDHFRRERFIWFRVHLVIWRGADYMPQSQGSAYTGNSARSRIDSEPPAGDTGYPLRFSMRSGYALPDWDDRARDVRGNITGSRIGRIQADGSELLGSLGFGSTALRKFHELLDGRTAGSDSAGVECNVRRARSKWGKAGAVDPTSGLG